ncbi:MAG TPA: hypothetical protein VMH28_20565 [Candidatus Acidoferrales bacterium]|nr:hypothetical protein [Candidatus Acidoferrales bacterium]
MLLASQIVIPAESKDGFQDVLNDHLDRLRPADGMEYGFIEEMVVSHWRLRRAWALEARMMEKEIEAQPCGGALDRMAAAFCSLAERPSLGLMHQYQTRLHLNYERALHNMILLRLASVPNEPSPISEHPPAIEAQLLLPPPKDPE